MYKCSLVLVLLALTTAQPLEGNQDPVYDAGVPTSSASLIFNQDTVLANPNQRLNLDCGVQGDFRSCIWENEISQKIYQVEDVHQGFWPGLVRPENTRGNECGIVIESVSPTDHGEWTCKVFVVANTLRGSKKVIVTVRPQKPVLEVNEHPLVVMEGEETEVACTVPAARPPATFRWYIGAKDITARSTTENVPTDDMGTYRSVSTLKYKYHHLDDHKNLICSIEHSTLTEPEYSEVPMDIRYAPYSLSSSQIYSIPIEEEYEIKYNFTANPLPDLRWSTGSDQITVPGESGRYMANIKQLYDNIYMATLKISDFTQDDIGTVYRLTARNEFGEKEFDVSLSTGPAPPDALSTGTMVAIIIVVTFILLLLCVICVMRYRQVYCFGQKDKVKDHLKTSGMALHEEHDTESSRAPSKADRATTVLKSFTSKFRPKAVPAENRLDKVEEGEAKDIKPKKQKKDRSEKTEKTDKPKDEIKEKEKKEKKDKKSKDKEGKSKAKKSKENSDNNKSEVVYAELEHTGNEQATRKLSGSQTSQDESTEYAEIVGTAPESKQ